MPILIAIVLLTGLILYKFPALYTSKASFSSEKSAIQQACVMDSDRRCRLQRYPDGFEICSSSRNLLREMCPLRSIFPEAFDQCFANLDSVLNIKRDLILLKTKLDSNPNTRPDLMRRVETHNSQGQQALNDVLNRAAQQNAIPQEAISKLQTAGIETFNKHNNDLQQYLSQQQQQ